MSEITYPLDIALFPSRRVLRINSLLSYYGVHKQSFADTSQAKWRIWREIKIGNLTKTEYLDDGQFSQVWDNVSTLYPAFTSEFSTSFDGVTEYLSIPSSASLVFGNKLSINFWVKPNSASVGNKYILSRWGAGGSRSFYVQLTAAGFLSFVFTSDGSTSQVISPADAVTLDAWNMVTITLDAAAQEAKIYYGGVLKKTQSTTGTSIFNSSNSIIISALYSGSLSGYFLGKLDELSFYNDILTQFEIGDIYNDGTPNNISILDSSAKLVSWYRMGDDSTAPVIEDYFTGGNDAEMFNMTDVNFVGDVP